MFVARRLGLAVFSALFFMAAFAPPCAAQGSDPHQIYEDRCHGCHFEHGADLARQKLRIANGTLQVARSGKTIDRLLRDHHGVRLTSTELSTLAELFRSGLKWGGVFQFRCAKCHQTAVSFARKHLFLSEDRVRTRGTERDVGTYLQTHGEASADEIKILLEMLKFQLRTAPGT
jgi:cytochrome c5